MTGDAARVLRAVVLEATGASTATREHRAGVSAEFDRHIARVKANALREAASALRAMSDDSPFVTVTGGLGRDDNGHDCGDFDHGYANWLTERADRIEEEAGLRWVT